MSRKESRRVFVIEQAIAGKFTVRQAATLLGLSERQIKRLKGGMQQEGTAFLAHKNRGRKPSHAIAPEIRELIVNRAQDLYQGPVVNTWPSSWPNIRASPFPPAQSAASWPQPGFKTHSVNAPLAAAGPGTGSPRSDS